MSMILYNIRHRGPYEYDKFVLNILQASNEVKRLLKTFRSESNSEIIQKKEGLRSYIDALSNEDGVLENILLAQKQFD